MDLLFRAYSTTSDDEDDNKARREPVRPEFPPEKRANAEYFVPKPRTMLAYRGNPSSNLPSEALISGRYISKRERAALASSSTVPDPNCPDLPLASPELGTISESNLSRTILSKLRHQTKGPAHLGQVPEGVSITLNGHTKPVNTVEWSRSHANLEVQLVGHMTVKWDIKAEKPRLVLDCLFQWSAHLLASAGMDHFVCIWNVWSREQKRACVLNFHKAAVKDVKWSEQGLFVLSCGYDRSSRLIDVERGIETQVFKEDQLVGIVKFHPNNFNIFLSGGSKGHLKLWDVRVGNVVHQYTRNLGPILDVNFSVDGKQLISSSDESRSNVSENSIIVWDVSRQVPLSNQVYVEAYTCPCIRCHPFDPYFIAQSNGNYIAIFSSKSPFKLDKYKRYESHGVFGFPIKCNFSLAGDVVASGSSDGCIYFYDSKSSHLIRKVKAHEQACMDVAFNPVMPAVVATCSWSGEVSALE